MPLYEYQCGSCGRRFELLQKFSDPPVEQCPTCGGEVQKLVSSPAIQFRGAGWYITDYARKGQPTGDAAPASGDGSQKASEGASGDSAGAADTKSSPASTPATPGSASESSGSATKTS